MPGWLPLWAVVLNSLAVEAVLVGVIYFVVVRRAENKRRAALVFFAVVSLLLVAEGLAGAEVFLPPRPRHSRLLAVDRLVGFDFDWEETLVLHKVSRPHVEVCLGDWHGFVKNHAGSADILLQPNQIVDDALLVDLWPLHNAVEAEEPEEGDFGADPVRSKGAEAWHVFLASKVARTDPRLVAYLKEH